MGNRRFQIRWLMIVIALVAVGLGTASRFTDALPRFDLARLMSFDFGLFLTLISFAIVPLSYLTSKLYDLAVKQPRSRSSGKKSVPMDLACLSMLGVASGSVIIGLNVRLRWEVYDQWVAESRAQVSYHQARRQCCVSYIRQIRSGADEERMQLDACDDRCDSQTAANLRSRLDLREQAVRRFLSQLQAEDEQIARYQDRVNHRYWYFLIAP